MLQDQLDEARKMQKGARALFRNQGVRQGEANTWNDEADVLLAQRRNDEALRAYRAARPLFRVAGETLGEANTWIGEAVALLALGRPQKSLQAARTALRRLRDTGAFTNELLVRELLIECQLTLADERAAVVEAQAALPLIQQLHESGIADEDRTSITENMSGPFDVLVPYYARQEGGAEKAAALAESAHAPVLRDLIGARVGTAARQVGLGVEACMLRPIVTAKSGAS